MQTAEIKTTSSAQNQIQMKRQPFFNKEGQGNFYSRSNEKNNSFFSPNTIQPKLTIGQPNDKYEVEADNMADKVVQRLSESSNPTTSVGTDSPGIQRKCASCEEEDKLQKKEDDSAHNDVDIQRKPIFESNAEQPDADIQSKALTIPNLQAKCSSCEQEEQLQKKEELPERKGALQRKAADIPSENSPNLESRLSSSKGSGSSLPSGIQSSMGSEFGTDFSNVRVHTSTQAVQMSQDIGAQAFTHGSDIYFNQGKYDTNSNSGKHLLAHELTHTVQQGGSLNLKKAESSNFVQLTPGNPHLRAIKKIEIYLEDSIVIVTRHDNSRFTLVLNYKETNIEAGTYKSKHTKGSKKFDVILGQSGFQWRYSGNDKLRPPNWSKIPTSEYELIVHGSFNDSLKTGGKKKGTGKDSGGDEGKGTGRGKGDGTTVGDKEKTGDGKNKGGDKGKGGGEGSSLTQEEKELLEAYKKALEQSGMKKTPANAKRVLELIKSLDKAAIRDLIRYLRDSKKGEDGTSFEEMVKKYANMSPSEREILRANLELESSGGQELPEQIKLNLKASAEETNSNEELGKKVDKKLAELAKIHKSVTHDNLIKREKADLSPLELAKLPLFTEMMMLEGLLAGAGQKSPELGAMAKDLTASIHEIRSYIQEEIAWLLGELAVGTIFAILTAPLSGGASIAVTAGRAALLLRRLNKLRTFIDKVQRIYSTYSTIKAGLITVMSGIEKYEEFKEKYEGWMRKKEELELKLEDADLGENIEDELDKIEGLIIDELQKQLDNPSGLGGLLDYMYIPEDADLKEILFNMPRGIEALKELNGIYVPGKGGDLEYTKTVAFKALRVGVLMYPLVGYLGILVSEQLQGLMGDTSLGDRLLGIVGNAVSKGKKRKKPDRKKNRKKMKEVQKPKKKPNTTDEKSKKKSKKPKGKAKKEDEKDDKDGEWFRLKSKAKALSIKCGSKGITSNDLLKEARRISKKYKGVAKAPSKPKQVAGRGYWKTTIKRKGGIGKIVIDALMTERTRSIRGKKAIQKALDNFNPEEIKKFDVDKLVAPFEEAFCYKKLKVIFKTSKQKGWYVEGTMSKSKKIIAFKAEVSDLHFGTEEDPIPIFWYKDDSWYKQQIKLKVKSEYRTYDFVSRNYVKLKLNSKKYINVQVGINKKNKVKEGDTLLRKSRKGLESTRKRYRKALGQHGFDWTNKDADHVQDLAFDGDDKPANLYPLNKYVNRWAFTGKWYRRYGFEYKDKTNPTKSKRSTLYRGQGKYFKIKGFRKKPEKLGGRTPKKWKSGI